jgi:SAM-dependent methyltransferase
MSNQAVRPSDPEPVTLERPCNICGSFQFVPGFRGRLFNGIPPCCISCKGVERHREVHVVYSRLTRISAKWRVLHFAPDRSVNPKWFASYRPSVFGTPSSLDMLQTGLPDASFDVVISNHVLEHVPNYIDAIRETLRLVGEEGFVHAMVPAQSWSLDDWAFPDPKRNQHWREFGADFALSVLRHLPGVQAIGIIAADPVTAAADIIYLFSRSAATLKGIQQLLPLAGIHVVRFS